MVAVHDVVVQGTHAERKVDVRGFPRSVHNKVVQRHVGSDSSPLGSTLVQLL